MSYTSESILAKGTKLNHVLELVSTLGYQKHGSWNPTRLLSINLPEDREIERIWEFSWFEEKDYKSWSGVDLSIYQIDGGVRVSTRTPISRSYFDLEKQNQTIKLLKRHFGGSFSTDAGAGRYLSRIGNPPAPAESGSHLAYQRFGINLIKCVSYFQHRSFKTDRTRPSFKSKLAPVLSELDPRILSNNLAMLYLCSILEDYWKSTFAALLRYSSHKERFLRQGRVHSFHLLNVLEGNLLLEEAVSDSLSFNRVSAACKHFNELDGNINFYRQLTLCYRQRKKNLYDDLEQLVTYRNEIVHRAATYTELTDDVVAHYMHSVRVSVERCYRHLTSVYGWPMNQWWHISTDPSKLTNQP